MIHEYWTTHCPRCDKKALRVAAATLCATGEILHPNSPLRSNGFDVGVDLKDGSTEDEIVVCDNCMWIFELSDLAKGVDATD